jgi:amino acid transporter
MKPLYLFAIVVLLAIVAIVALGVVLIRLKKIRSRHVPNFTRLSTLLILASAYSLSQSNWPGVHMRELDMWSMLVILAILTYSIIHAGLTSALPKAHEDDFAKSYMLSMLYTDSERMANAELQDIEKKRANAKAKS